MVDPGLKTPTNRQAVVEGVVAVSQACRDLFTAKAIDEITSVARVAGVMAAKKVDQLIPFCHTIPMEKITIDITWQPEACQFQLVGSTSSFAKTGVEMEAFLATQIAAITIYDMIKSADPEAIIGPFYLKEKIGGKQGHWGRQTAG